MLKSTFLRRPSVIIPLVIVAVALAVPQSRAYFLMQLGIYQTKWGYTDSILFGTNKTLTFKTPRNNWEKWSQFIATVQHTPSESDAAFYDENDVDSYIEKHPELTWLLAERIRTLFSHSGLPRRGEERYVISQYPNSDGAAPGKPQNKMQERKKLFPRIARLCHLGQQQEPQNAYYDLVLSAISYSLFKDKQGWHYFLTASHKSDFDPHYQDLMHVQLYLDRQIVGHPLTQKEKEISSSVVLFRDLMHFRSLARWLQWWASRDIRGGDISKAMQTMQAMNRMGALIARHAQRRYVASLGTIMTSLAAQTPWKALQISYTMPGPPHIRFSQDQIFRYTDQFAREHHLPALRQMVTSNFQLRYYTLRAQDLANQSRLDIGEQAVMTISWNIGVWMLVWMIGAAVILLMARFFQKEPQPISAILRFVPSGISIAALLLLLVIFYWLWLGNESKLHRNLGPDIFAANSSIMSGLSIRGIFFLMPLLFAFLASVSVSYAVYKNKLKAERKPSAWGKKLKVLLSESTSAISSFWLWTIYTLIALSLWIWGDFDFAVAGLPIFIGIIYELSSALWHFIRSPRTPLKKRYWNSVFSATRFSLSSVLIVTAVLYGICLTVTTVSQQRAAQKLAPFYHKNGLLYFANPHDLTVRLTPEQFHQYQKQWAARNTSNRIDW